MSYKVEYAGIPLHDYINIFNVHRKILPTRENFTKDIPSLQGKFYMGYKYAPREITLECMLNANSREEYVEIIRELAFILDVNVPTKMIIDDEPDKYFYAVIDGSLDTEKILNNAKFELKFICYNPYLYSVEKDIFSDYPLNSSAKAVTIHNDGSATTYPIIDVGFTKDAHFLQCTDVKGRTVLIGTPPDVDKTQGSFNPQVLKENCETLTNWNPAGNVIDEGVVDGDIMVNSGGWGFTCSNFGSNSGGWHGGARRVNLSQEVADFKVEVKMMHNSKGDLRQTGAGTKPPSTSSGGSVKYVITADPSLRVRNGRGTNYSKLTSIPKGKVVDVSDIQNNWGKVTYNSKTGYIYMQYTKKYTSSSSSSSSNSYKTTDNLRIRSGRGTKYKTLTTIPKGTTVSVTDIKDNWGRVSYKGKNGYSYMKYMKKVSNTLSPLADEVDTNITAEDRLGKIEVYGFDRTGNKLFKMSIKDISEWYENTYPEIQIGSKIELIESHNTPAPKTTQVKDEKDEKKTVTKKIDSGRFGNWNEFEGWFTIERKDNKWKCKIEKTDESGKVIRKIETSTLSNASYPKGSLANLVIWFGKYKENVVVDLMSINEIYVTNIGTPPKPKENKPIFKAGDSLIVDFGEQTARVLRSGQVVSMMDEIDIGSEFFTCPIGESQIGIKSDDVDLDVDVTIQKRWL